MNQSTDTRTVLLETARTLIAQHGYDGASIRAITGAAGANLGAITYHFGTKYGLYEAVLDSITAPLRERIRLATSSPGAPLDRIEAAVRAIFAHWREHPDWPAVIAHELALDRPMPVPAARTMQDVASLIGAQVRAGQEKGDIVAGDPLLLTFSIVSQPIYLALVGRKLRDALQLDTSDAAVHAQFVEHVVAFVRRSLAVPRRVR